MWQAVPIQSKPSPEVLPTTTHSQNNSSFLLRHALQNLTTALPTPLTSGVRMSSWIQLCELVAEAKNWGEVRWNEAGNVGKELVGLLAAVKTGNGTVQKQLEGEKSLGGFVDAVSGVVDVNRVVLECVKKCVADGLEDLACGCVEVGTPELPLYVVHRAGEQGMLRFLSLLHYLQLPIKTNRVLTSLPSFVRRFFNRKEENQFQRFPANHRTITEQDLLHWAALTGGRNAVQELIKQNPEFSVNAIIEVLVSEGLEDLIRAVISGCKLASLDLYPLINHGHVSLAIDIIESTRKRLSNKTPKQLRPYQVLNKLITLIADPDVCISSLYLLSLVQKFEWNELEVDLLLETLRKCLFEADIENNVIVNCQNSLLFCVGVTELCMKVTKFSLYNRDNFLGLAESYLQLAETIQSKYTDYRKLKVLYLDRIYGSYNLFEIITCHRLL